MQIMKEMSRNHTKTIRLIDAGGVEEAGGADFNLSTLVTQKAVPYKMSHEVTALPGATATGTRLAQTIHRSLNPTRQAGVASSFLRFHTIRV